MYVKTWSVDRTRPTLVCGGRQDRIL